MLNWNDKRKIGMTVYRIGIKILNWNDRVELE